MNLLRPDKYAMYLPASVAQHRPTYGPDGRPAKNILQGKLREAFLLGIGGGDSGFNEAADVIEVLADGTDTNELWNAYRQAVALRNAERQPLIDFLSYFVSQDVEKIFEASSTARFERASEYGVPRSHRPEAAPSYMGFDFDWFDLGLRYTWEFLANASASQVDAISNQALEADNILVFQMVMWTLFNNVNRAVDIKTRPYNVFTFWNGADGEVPPSYRTNTFTNTHSHYLVSGAATVDSGDLDQMYLSLSEHGYKRSNGNNLVLIVNQEQGDTIRTFKSVQNGGSSKWDFIPAQGTPLFLIPRDFVQPQGVNAPPATVQGMDVIGTYGEFTIVQEDYMPAKYMVAFATGGQNGVQNPVGIRQHSNPALRGLRLVKGRSPDYPLQEAYYQRGFGTGIRHRGAGVVMQVKASGSYTLPTEYSVSP
jgi:hypothetical protein